MKKSLIKGLLLSTLLVFAACNENDNDRNKFDGDANGFISFGTSTSGSILENATSPITITAYASVPNISSDFTVDATVASADASASDYIVVDGKSQFSFGPDKYVDTIQILPVDNLDTGDDKTITVTLSNATNGAALGVPGPDAVGSVYTLTLQEDDCPFTVMELGEASWSGMDNVPANQAGPNDSMITTSFNGTNLLFKGIGYAWLTDTSYWDEVIIDDAEIVATVDALTGDITIDEQYLCRTTWNGDVQPDYSVSATGKYVACSKTLTLTYNLHQGGGILRTFTDTLTMN